MANLTDGIKAAAIPSLPLDGAQTVVDVGGADGAMLAAILTAHPGLRGVLFDLPRVVAAAPGTLASYGVDDRVECAGGDFLHSVPSGGDVYLASMVLHDWPDEAARAILANIAAAGGSGARLLLLEFVVPPGDAPHPSKISDLNMLAMSGRQGTHRNRMARAPHRRGLRRHRHTPDRHTIFSHPGNSAVATPSAPTRSIWLPLMTPAPIL